ncbi:biopolymer transporter ExbD [Advenella sp. S44]|uniref:ExbD/TolR family protein n=1 Tax=Advenella sp. S44 TaxID=1982755 RepID=UPI000C2AB665|nr:biopolymer transporter ExbD [Advenella sp. S44]PJX23826.1 biopolymer transporter ExbD [Advenella sp. S44]
MAFGSFDQKNGSASPMTEINMVPLIDVMLVLLVIFIITAPLMAHSIKIDLPQVSSKPVEQEPVIIDLAMDKSGAIYWNDEPVEQNDLREMFVNEGKQDPQPELRIRADADTRYEELAQVLSLAKGSGLKKLGFITQPGSESAAGGSEKSGDSAAATPPAGAPAATGAEAAAAPAQ